MTVCNQAGSVGATMIGCFGPSVSSCLATSEFGVFNSPKYHIFPGFCDVHVHFREPGFSYKETIRTGSLAAAHGGYTTVCTMPNLNPVPDTLEHLQQQLARIQQDARIQVIPFGSITMGQQGGALSEMDKTAPFVAGFSDDGKGIQSEVLMRQAMTLAKKLGKPIAAHCEDNTLLRSGYVHDGVYAAAHNHRGICSESEWRQIARDLRLARDTGCAYHVCHISTKESVALIRQAKAEGLDVTCETAPHYLVMDEGDLQEDGRFKMNPPLRGAADRLALIEGIRDGTIDMIATDHAPHSAEEKSRGLEKSTFGVVGLETAFPVLYTRLVKTGIISLEKLIDLLVTNPRKRFCLPLGCDFSVWDLHTEARIDPHAFLSMGKATPFAGWKVFGECVATVCGGRLVWQNPTANEPIG